MYFRPSRALLWITCCTVLPSACRTATVKSLPPRVQARMMQITSRMNRAGIPTEQTFSMPLLTPHMTMSRVMSTKIRP